MTDEEFARELVLRLNKLIHASALAPATRELIVALAGNHPEGDRPILAFSEGSFVITDAPPDPTCKCGAHADLGEHHPFKVRAPHWRTEPDGERTCSYCGSWHLDEFRAFLEAFDGTNGQVSLADGRHKAYVRRTGREWRKFYLWHARHLTLDEFKNLATLFDAAIAKSKF